MEEAKQWIAKVEAYHQRNGLVTVGVFKKDDFELAGQCDLKQLEDECGSPVELMYRMSDLYWGQGFGLELGRALVNYAFEWTNLIKLVATVDHKNIGSKKIRAKLDF